MVPDSIVICPGMVLRNSLRHHQQVMVTPMHTVLTAKMGHTKEGVESLHFLQYIIGSKDQMCV